jgi:hypothetical protein
VGLQYLVRRSRLKVELAVDHASNTSYRARSLVGKRVRVRAFKEHGSARLLDGLTGIVTAVHEIAADWVKLKLDPNPITPCEEWSLPEDRLVVCEPSGKSGDSEVFQRQ